MEKIPSIGVFIGRFQPLHNGHLAAIQTALEKEDHLIIVVGSACQAKSVKNPWTSQERQDMIRSCLSTEDNKRVSFIHAKDYLYNNTMWLVTVQARLEVLDVSNNPKLNFSLDEENYVNSRSEVDLDNCRVTVYGRPSDRDDFPQWDFFDVGNKGDADAAQARDYFFHKNTLDLKRVCPEPVFLKLKNEIDANTAEYQRLYGEFRYIVDEKAKWSNSPYPLIFVTTDAIVIKSGHILVGRRRGKLGKGLLALPGGFLRDDEPILDGCLRELKEETRLGLPKDEMRKRIRENHVFDHPLRSLRGRTITHAFCFDLGSGPLPRIKGDDDMEKAQWMPLSDVDKYEEEFFEDHWHIINFFTKRF